MQQNYCEKMRSRRKILEIHSDVENDAVLENGKDPFQPRWGNGFTVRSIVIFVFVFSLINLIGLTYYISNDDKTASNLTPNGRHHKEDHLKRAVIAKKDLYEAVAYPNKNEKNLASNHTTTPESESMNLKHSSSAAVMNTYHCNAIENNTAPENEKVRYIWNELDSITASYKGSRISGGLFLYPRQTQMLTKLIDNLLRWKEEEHRHDMSNERNFLQICETGFGAGHSASFFLAISNKTKVISFDKFDRPYQLPILEKLKQTYTDRLHHVPGNSCKSVPNFFKESSNHNLDAFQGCDLIHGSSLCPTDNIDLVTYSSKSGGSSILTSTAMNSLSDNNVYFGKMGQWQRLKNDGCISDITCFNEVPAVLNRTFIFAQKGENISHKFCFARVTGKCHHKAFLNGNSQESNNDTRSMTNEISNILMKDMCPRLRVEHIPQ